MPNDVFYGSDRNQTLSYLEFGGIDLAAGKKVVWDLKLHQKAYDWYMCSRYANDLIAYRTMQARLPQADFAALLKIYFDEIHHQNDFSVTLAKCAALSACRASAPGRTISFCELGQTLFGCIDAMAFCRDVLARLEIPCPLPDLRDVRWIGVDISEFFNHLSELLHPDYRLKTCTEWNSRPGDADIFFAKGVTLLYAVRHIDQLSDYLRHAKIGLFDYSFSLGPEREVMIGSGKVIRYLSLAKSLESLRNLPNRLWVKIKDSRPDNQNNTLYVDCLYADLETGPAFMEYDRSIRSALLQRLSGLSGADLFLDSQDGKNSGWLPMPEFVEGLSL